MILAQALADAKNKGYKRAWLTTDNHAVLCAELWFEWTDSWKNMGLSPYVVEEYKNVPVLIMTEHPTQHDTMMLDVEYQFELHNRARERCLQDAKETW